MKYLQQADSQEMVSLGASDIYLATQKYAIEDQQCWADDDEYKDFDFTAAPYWIYSSYFAPIEVHCEQDVIDFIKD